MNAPEAHYVANADAKIQPFSGMAITLRLFFYNNSLPCRPKRVYLQTIMHKASTNGKFLALFV